MKNTEFKKWTKMKKHKEKWKNEVMKYCDLCVICRESLS